MKFMTLVATIAILTVLLIPSSSVDAGEGAGGVTGDFYKIVRAEYVDPDGNQPHTQTTIHLLNSSIQPVTLSEIYILGPGGATDIQATYTATQGMILPPLARFDLRINSNIPGVLPTTNSASLGLGSGYPIYGTNLTVTSVVAGWIGGSIDQVQLSATIDRNPSGSLDHLERAVVEGVPVVF